mmetsp:Transcript_10261/g.18057  ORF Transcript_10261/g.18057 Transcript_10261/m.18057 type:complete len:104 (+) Transcript_10261:50-361(+)
MAPISYAKWDNLEFSSDEEESVAKPAPARAAQKSTPSAAKEPEKPAGSPISYAKWDKIEDSDDEGAAKSGPAPQRAPATASAASPKATSGKMQITVDIISDPN